jgi:hypothetical protein
VWPAQHIVDHINGLPKEQAHKREEARIRRSKKTWNTEDIIKLELIAIINENEDKLCEIPGVNKPN